MAESFPLTSNDGTAPEAAPPPPTARRRPRPGERREQILQTLAAMLEQPGGERITTAALAARLEVSEAALYRHFASKAQMFEGLIDFIEQSVFALVAQIVDRDMPEASQVDGTRRAARVVAMVLQFGERNPGMVRVMVGDALVFENERLQQRMGQFFDRIESTLRQCLRSAAEAAGSATPTVDAQVRAAALCDLVRGRLQRYARSGLRRPPTEHLDATLALLLH
ncbi:nucleoid occlusion factor SlmA [Paracidovorax avenae]|uniref:nucleoid occlusion factor SlmA n=1 Tax=Paracidovorax avenae TaxID=80867 RepID=UPI000D208393|nr:nucleoid occlusion factor SlmA [Paracidovorax avenae]AVS85999.1 nucleoid occlusion factor SlmA [Paracidovorax avenae]AVS96705.1 nucleoid occlusion factor SlmA [Paracidovorax avenae]AVT10728.1 nucleoid occlusion factor SlmA [Paracidovorax avenae]